MIAKALPYMGDKLPIKGRTKLYTFGDSITAGYDYPTQVSTHLGLTLTNLAVSGEGIPMMCLKANQNLTNDGVVTTATGRNDLAWRSGEVTLTGTYAKWGHAVVLANQFAASFSKANDATKIGTWSTVNKTSIGSKYTDCQQSGTATSYLEFSVTGTDFVVCMIGSNTTNSTGRFKIYLDGVEKYDITGTTNFYDYTWFYSFTEVAGGFPLLNCGSGSHTIKVEVMSGTIVCDFVSILDNPDNCGSVVLGELIDTVGYPSAQAAVKASVTGLVSDFRNRNYPIAYLPTNKYWKTDGSMNPPPDTVHPNQAGQDCFAVAFISKFKA